jgi:phage shock protein PspC (stress-responsive transcriptional regulator)
MMNKKLYKSKTDRVLFGVCGGIAEYFDVDAVIIRLLMLVFALTGAGILFYIFAAIIMREGNEPRTAYRHYATGSASGASYGAGGAETYSGEFSEEPAADGAAPPPPYTSDSNPARSRGRGSGVVILGLILIIIGIFYLINRFIPIFAWIDIRAIFAVFLVLVGVYFVAKR